ncbi:MAG: hypothetical protein ACNS63_00180 [Candidatus Nitrospinota bacterium M3_3B_026]
MKSPKNLVIIAAVIAIAAGSGCSKLEKGASAAGEKVMDELMGRGGAERGVSIGESFATPDAEALRERGVIPPGADVRSYIPGVADDTVNFSTDRSLDELAAFYTKGMKAKGFENENLTRAGEGLYGRWTGPETDVVTVYFFRDGSGVKGAVTLPREEAARR